jgi:hypothetical protein
MRSLVVSEGHRVTREVGERMIGRTQSLPVRAVQVRKSFGTRAHNRLPSPVLRIHGLRARLRSSRRVHVCGAGILDGNLSRKGRRPLGPRHCRS